MKYSVYVYVYIYLYLLGFACQFKWTQQSLLLLFLINKVLLSCIISLCFYTVVQPWLVHVDYAQSQVCYPTFFLHVNRKQQQHLQNLFSKAQ